MDKSLILPKINNYSFRKEWETDCWKKILGSKDLMGLIITADERHDLVLRAAAIGEIYSGKTYREISKNLFISQQTISGIKKALKEKNYRSYRDRSRTERKKKIYSSGPKQKIKSGHIGEIGFYRRTKYGKVWIPL